jgi:hypothetical protein
MFKNAMQQVMSTIGLIKKDESDDGHKDIYGRVVERGDDFFHPQKFRGIPVFDVKSILKHYKSQLDKIKQHVEIGDQRRTKDGRSLYDVIYTDVIELYVEFCHMIPASEDHHHSHTGGLLLHSLEASVESLRWAKEKQSGLSGFVDIDAKVKPVMNYCAWLAGLLHDAGKMMRDMSVDAVEIYNPITRKQGPATETIMSWHPAKESLIEWAKRNHIASYSVNFLSTRVHNRHNIDSSQILQPLLRNHYAMDYLFSTPIKQEVYSALTAVLSGYSTSDDFLSEAVRMGDSASTSRSLGYLYDSKLGSREMSTAQRLYRSIRHAAKDWRWNEVNSNGWIIGGDVFIRWSSTVEDIIKVSQALGYSLPIDVKNVLNIMESNNITELFDVKSPDDRIVRFTPGQFTREELVDIQAGRKQVKWDDLLKIRGPQVVFAESPMPFSKEGLLFLPTSGFFFTITKEGVLTKLASLITKKEDAKKPVTIQVGSKTPDIESNNDDTEQASLSLEEDKPVSSDVTPKVKKPTKKPAAKKPSSSLDTIEVMPKSTSSNKTGLNGIHFSNAPTDNKAPNHQVEKTPKPVSESKSKPKPSKAKRCSDTLKSIVDSSPSFQVQDNHALIPVSEVPVSDDYPIKDVISALEKNGELEINISNPTIKTVMVEIEGKKQKCIKLTQSASQILLNQGTQSDEASQLSGRPSKQSTQTGEAADNVKAKVTSKTPVKKNVSKQTNPQSTPIEDKQTEESPQSKPPSFEAKPPTKVQQRPYLDFPSVVNLSTSFMLDGAFYVDVGLASILAQTPQEAVVEYLHSQGCIEMSSDQTPLDMIENIEHEGQSRPCVLMTKESAQEYLNQTSGSEYFSPGQAELFTPALPERELTSIEQIDYLVRVSDKGSFIRYLSNLDALSSITENGLDGYFFDHHALSHTAMKVVNKSRLKNYMHIRGIHENPKGYLLSSEQLVQMKLSEVSYE